MIKKSDCLDEWQSNEGHFAKLYYFPTQRDLTSYEIELKACWKWSISCSIPLLSNLSYKISDINLFSSLWEIFMCFRFWISIKFYCCLSEISFLMKCQRIWWHWMRWSACRLGMCALKARCFDRKLDELRVDLGKLVNEIWL